MGDSDAGQSGAKQLETNRWQVRQISVEVWKGVLGGKGPGAVPDLISETPFLCFRAKQLLPQVCFGCPLVSLCSHSQFTFTGAVAV